MKKACKYFNFLIFTLILVFSFSLKVNAASFNGVVSTAEATCVCKPSGGGECQSYFGDPTCDGCPAYWIQQGFNLIKYIAIAALLVLVTMDFFKALVQNDKDALKKAGTSAMKRFIYCVIIFFLPILIEFIMNLFGAYGTCGIR